MWKNAEQFASAAYEEAALVFGKLDSKLLVNVQTIGLAVDDEGKPPGPCVLFVDELIAPSDLVAVLSDAKVRHSQFRTQGLRVVRAGIPSDECLWLMAVQDALSKAVGDKVGREGQIAFVSLPVKINGYLVSVVLLFNKTAYQSFPSLDSNRRNQGAPHGVSLLESTKDEFLHGCQDALRRPDPGHNRNVLECDPEEVLRAAGKRFLDGPAQLCSAKDRQYSLFRAFDDLSSLPYEGRECKGSIFLASDEHPCIKMMIALEKPPRVNDRGAFRKLFELATEGSHLVVTQFGEIKGVGTQDAAYDPIHKDLFEVRLVKHHTWALVHDEKVLMQVEFGTPRLPKPKIDCENLKDHLRKLFPGMAVTGQERFVKLIGEAASLCGHGTTVVIREDAAEEAKRLKGECWPIRPTAVTGEEKEKLKALTSIDGALLLDPSCVCHAIGVILDGKTTGRGTPARGARYNSAVRYVGNAKAGVLVVTVSQDGMVNLMPDLKPQFSRREIEGRIDKLRRLDADGCLDVGKLNGARIWFEDKRDYLTPAYCDQINSLWSTICARFAPSQPVETAAEGTPVPMDEYCEKLGHALRRRPWPFAPLGPSRDFDEGNLLED